MTISLTPLTVLCSGLLISSSIYWTLFGYSSLLLRAKVKKRHPKKNYKIGVVIPACNEEKVIGDIITSLRNQTYPNWKAVIVCHNCTDNTYQKAREATRGDSRIVVIEVNRGDGKAIALNEGVKLLQDCDIIAQYDADNIIHPLAFENAVKYFEEYDAIQGRLLTKNANANLLTKMQEIEFDLFSHMFWYGRLCLGKPSPLAGTNSFFKREILEKVDYWSNELVEDFDLFMKLANANARIAYAKDVVAWDEKPDTWKALIKQRRRWIKGHLRVAMKNSKMLRKVKFDVFYLWSPVINLIWVALTVLFLLKLLVLGPMIDFWYPSILVWATFTVIHLIFTITLFRKYGHKFKYLFPFILYQYHWIPVTIRGLFLKNNWKISKTEHIFNGNNSIKAKSLSYRIGCKGFADTFWMVITILSFLITGSLFAYSFILYRPRGGSL